jgi:hypothetical protein
MLDAAIIVNLYSEHKSHDDTCARHLWTGYIDNSHAKKIYVSIFYRNNVAAEIKKKKER